LIPRQRPLGITVLAIVTGLGGVLSLLLGGLALSMADQLAQLIVEYAPELTSAPPDLLAGVIDAFAVVLALVGVVSLLNSFGLWKGKRWAWALSMVLAILGALSGLFALPSGALGLIVNALIIYYLTRAHVRDYFRRPEEMEPTSTA
jgi:lysylphosphatidylglycerol synthetase-like protein (DUF2156 family)